MTSDERLELIRQIPIHGQDIADEFERLQELLSVFRAWKSEIENGNSEDNRWCLASAHNWMQEAKRFQRDSERYRYIRDNHARAHSPHMDGTFGWALRSGIKGRHTTFDEAIDAALEDK